MTCKNKHFQSLVLDTDIVQQATVADTNSVGCVSRITGARMVSMHAAMKHIAKDADTTGRQHERNRDLL
jgi:hypothetical protein